MGLVRAALALALGLLALLVARPALADELAPELELQELRAQARVELSRLEGGLAANDQRRLAGLYLAFDPDASDPSAMVGCDDDGDYVIVMSDAMMRLTSIVARAAAFDEANGSRKVEDYAGFVARAQIPGRRLLPPPPGFYIADKPADVYGGRLSEALSFVLASELSRLRAGDLVCPHPTATHEHGDDTWTDKEQRRALQTAETVYPGNATSRDTEAAVRVLDSGHDVTGALALLRFFAQLEVERAVVATRFVSTYRRLHPSAATRLATVRVAAESRR